MARLANGAVVQKVLVELRLRHLPGIVLLHELVDADLELIGVRLEDAREVGRLRLGRDAKSVGAEAREARLDIEPGFGHPDCVVLFDGASDPSLEPGFVFFGVAGVELGEDLEDKVGEEGRLGPAEVVARGIERQHRADQVVEEKVPSVSVQDLAVVPDLEQEVVDDTLGEVDKAVGEESERDEVAVPLQSKERVRRRL